MREQLLKGQQQEIDDYEKLYRDELTSFNGCINSTISSSTNTCSICHPRSLTARVTHFLRTVVWPGLGLLSESYILFSIGTLHPIYTSIIIYITTPTADNNDDTTTATAAAALLLQTQLLSLLNTIPYGICCSIMLGMIVIGVLCDIYGRRIASLLTASCMLCGCIISTAIPAVLLLKVHRQPEDGTDELSTSYYDDYYYSYFIVFIIGMVIFAFGVGGEYPVSASTATETSLAASTAATQQERKEVTTMIKPENKSGSPTIHQLTMDEHRTTSATTTTALSKNGKHIQLIFSMQGVGILLQVIVLTILLCILQYRYSIHRIVVDNNVSNVSFLVHGYIMIWFIIYCIGTILLSIVSITRFVHLKESKIWLLASSSQQLHQQEQQQHVSEIIQPKNIDDHTRYFNDVNRGNNDMDMKLRTLSQKDMDTPKSPAALSSCPSSVPSLSIPSVTMIGLASPSEVNRSNYSNDACYTVEHNGEIQTNFIHINDDEKNTSNGITRIILVPFHDEKEHQNSRPTEPNAQDDDLSEAHHVEKYHWTEILKILFFHTTPKYFYCIRLGSVSIIWFLWDITFYGNKLFQSSFLLSILSSSSSSSTSSSNDDMDDMDVNNDDSSNEGMNIYGITTIESMIQLSIAATINSIVALCGYIVAAYIIDRPTIGRRNLQLYGLLITGMLFISVGFLYDTTPTSILIVLYFGTSFFGQCGPNATTFILPSEIFPTGVRTMCHGIAAASGKFGALIATIVFHHVLSQQQQKEQNDTITGSTIDLFLLSGYASFVAAILTYWFIPETAGLDLTENDRYWESILRSYALNRKGTITTHYHHNPKSLSLCEQRQKVFPETSDRINDDNHSVNSGYYYSQQHDDSFIYN